MAGTGLINIIFGFIGFLIVFISAYTNNSFLTSMIRGLLAFVSFFLIAFLFRWMFHFIMRDPSGNTMKRKENPSNVRSTTHYESEIEQIKQSIDSLSEEEAEQAARYIKEMLNEKDK